MSFLNLSKKKKKPNANQPNQKNPNPKPCAVIILKGCCLLLQLLASYLLFKLISDGKIKPIT